MTWVTRVLADGTESAGEMKFKCPSCQKWTVNHDSCPHCGEPPESMTEMKFRCPFCQKWVDYDGGCPHFVFSFEEVNFEYLTCAREFANV